MKLTDFISGEIQWSELEEKCRGAVNFFYKNVAEKILLPLKKLYSETIGTKGLKTFNEETKMLLHDLEEYIEKLKTCYLLDVPLFDKEIEMDTSTTIVKKPTHMITFEMFDEGMPLLKLLRNETLPWQLFTDTLRKWG